MLKTLRRIVQEINSAHHFDEALQILVRRVREAIATEACTVFLVDHEHNEYVLLATDGLNPQAVGQVRLKMDEGLVGLVGRREELINLENAPSHPNFFYTAEVSEERYKAFLGVPIIHTRRLLGVLIVQQGEQRCFDEEEEAFLITMSAQLGGVIAHAEATGAIKLLFLRNANSILTPTQDIILTGSPSAPGIGIGHAVVIYPLADLSAVPNRKITDPEAECLTFSRAIAATRADIRSLSKRFASLPNEERVLFDVYLRILDRDGLEAEVMAEIQNNNWAQGALREVINRHIRKFESMDDDYLRERAADLRDLGQRVLVHLQAHPPTKLNYPEKTILIGEEITASILVEVPEGQLVGIAARKGSSHSHVAIVARALGIATVLGVENLPLQQLESQTLIVDGYQGQIYLNPSPKISRTFTKLIHEQLKFTASLEELRLLPAKTLDDHCIALWVNTGLAADAALALTAGAEGVGLYRTEMPFLTRDSFPSEDEQYVIYRQLLNAFAPRPVIMRTLDVGGDKILSYFPVQEANPFLGWRGIRITLDHPEIFLMQLRAMLRASEGLNNLRIMLPMISNASEADDALRLIRQAHQELQAEGMIIKMPEVGIMIEVPSAVYQAAALAQRVDFLSIGSNDLTQYLLAVDRNNARVAYLYDGLHPAVLQALLNVVNAARAQGKPVSICGEMASDPIAIPLLLAMGFDALSMNSTALLRTKWVIRNFTLAHAQEILAEVLAMDNPKHIRSHMEDILKKVGLGTLINIGKPFHV